MKNPIKLTLAYSCLIKDESSFFDWFSELFTNFDNFNLPFLFWSEIEFLLSVQSPPELFTLIQSNLEHSYFCSIFNIRLIYAGEAGLSKSRNYVIKSACGTYIHFLDRDCSFQSADSLYDFVRYLDDIFDIVLIDQIHSTYATKRFSASKYISHCIDSSYTRPLKIPFYFFSISAASYQIVARRLFLYRYNLLFDENLGLGSTMPQSEEVVFLFKSIFSANSQRIGFYCKNLLTAESLCTCLVKQVRSTIQVFFLLKAMLFIKFLVCYLFR